MSKQQQTPIFTEQQLGEFATKQWDKTVAFLRKNFPAFSTEDCEDIFQESFIVLINNCKQGKVTTLTSSLATYFTKICINKANDRLKSREIKTKAKYEKSLEYLAKPDIEKVEALISLDPEIPLRERKIALARQIVHDLPKPCDDMLWGYYYDNLSLRTIADMLKKTVGYVKVTKHRCMEKFHKRWDVLKKNALDM